MKEVNSELEKLDIPFHLIFCDTKDDVGKQVYDLVKEHDVGCIVVDFSPLRIARGWVDDLKIILPKDVALCEVSHLELL